MTFPQFQDGNNLVVINGQNGFGKTSLLRALEFVFRGGYGKAELQEADLNGANLQKAVLTKADLQGVDLMRTNLEGASLERANLQGVKNLTVEQLCTTHTLYKAKGLSPKMLAEVKEQYPHLLKRQRDGK